MNDLHQEIIDLESRRDACHAALKQAERSFSQEQIDYYRKTLIKLNKELQCLRKNYLTSSQTLPTVD